MSRRIIVLLVFGTLIASAAALLAARMTVTTDMSMFLPHAATQKEKLLIEELKRGAAGKTLMVGLQGAAPAILAEASRAMAAHLRETGLFAVIANGQALTLPETERARLFAYRYLLSPAVSTERFSTAGLRAALEQRWREMVSTTGFLQRDLLPADPTGEFLNVLERFGGMPIRREHGVFFSRDGERAILLLTTRAPGSELDEQERAIAAVRAAYAAVAQEGMELLITGPALFAVEARADVRGDIARLSILSGALVFGILVAVFRALPAVLLAAVPLAVGVLGGLAAVTLLFPAVHGITIAFGTTLLGVAVDYPIHFLSHLSDPSRPALACLLRIWPTLRLGMLTTAIGFSALLFSDYGGLAQLGVFSVTGLLAAGAATRFLLPALTPATFTVREHAEPLARTMTALARRAPRLRAPLVVLVALAAAVLAWKGQAVWEIDLARLNPLPETRKHVDRLLRTDLGAPDVEHLLVVLAPDAEQALERLEALAAELDTLVQEGAIAGYQAATHVLPSAATQRARQAALPDTRVLEEALARAQTGLPFRRGLFEPFLQDIEQARRLEPLTPAQLAGTWLGERLAPLLFAFEGRWAAPVLLRGLVPQPQRLAALASESGAVEVVYLDIKKESARIMEAYRDRALTLLAFGMLGVLAAVGFALRMGRRALTVLATPAAAVLVAGGVLVSFGTGLTLFHLIALLLVVGIGIDYALFFDRLCVHAEEWHTTFPAIWKSWLTTLAVFGSLITSKAAVLQAIGSTVVLGVTLCLLLAAAFGGARR